jgi:hypothetical protein
MVTLISKMFSEEERDNVRVLLLKYIWLPEVTIFNHFHGWLLKTGLPCENTIKKVILLLGLVIIFSICLPCVPCMFKWKTLAIPVFQLD